MIKLRHKTGILCLFIAIAGIVDTGCNAFTRTQRGAAIGAGAGATVGGFIGKFAGNPALGAIIGGAVGGTAGEFIGRNIDKQAIDIEKLTVQGATITHKGESYIVNFDPGILFEPGKAHIDSSGEAHLKSLVTSLQSSPQANVIIIGHADNKEGTPEYTMELSAKRADSVKYYIASSGIDTLRLNTQAKGQSEPLGDNNADAGRALNRRVDIIIVANEQMKNQSTASQAKN